MTESADGEDVSCAAQLHEVLAGYGGRAAPARSPKCRRSKWAATGTRKICGARRPSTPRCVRMRRRTIRCIRSSWCWGRGTMAAGAAARATRWAGSSAKLRSADRRPAILPHDIEAPFFEFYLKGKPGFDLEDTASFRTGENAWHRYAVWPPKAGFHATRAYLAPDKALTFAAPKGDYDVKAAAYVADPADPVPYRHRPIQSTYGRGSTWRTWLVEDQNFVSGRKDLANFETPALTGQRDRYGRCGRRLVRRDDRNRCGLGGEADRCVRRKAKAAIS